MVLSSLPLLIEGYAPDPSRLPGLLLALARVDWERETACFRGVARALASAYALAPLTPVVGSGGGAGGSPAAAAAVPNQDDSAAATAAAAAAAAAVASGGRAPTGPLANAAHTHGAGRAWVARHVVLPALRAFLRPARQRARDGSVVLVTSMERLYRTFERCG